MKIKETKEKILRALDENRYKLLCPFCKCDRFLRTGTTFCSIEDDGESITDTDISGEDYTFKCTNCKKDLTDVEFEKRKI